MSSILGPYKGRGDLKAMTVETFQLSDDAALLYERQKVPGMFKPLANAVLARVPVASDERIVDLACGTGIVARLAAAGLGPGARITGADLNPGMIRAARALTAAEGERFHWHEADVSHLPFPDGAFSLAFCQQGLQFFPDKPAALREIARVLAPAGRLALTVWSEIPPLFEAIAAALARHFDADLAARGLAPFAFRDETVIAGLILDAGFAECAAERLAVERSFAASTESLRDEIIGNPVGADFAAGSAARQEAVLGDVLAVLAPYRRGDIFDIPQPSHLFLARKP